MSSLKNPSYQQVKTRPKHDYVVPMNTFPCLPTLSSRTRMLRNGQYTRRISFPPSIKEEDEEDEEDIPLALLAYKKGLIVPDSNSTLYPLVQHCIQQPTMKRHHYYHYPTFILPPSDPPQLYHRNNSNQSSSSLSSSSSGSSSTPSTNGAPVRLNAV